MKLLQRYPWVIPNDGEEWVPVEATPVAEKILSDVLEAANTNGPVPWHLPCTPPWDRTALEFTFPKGVRNRMLLLVRAEHDEHAADEYWQKMGRGISKGCEHATPEASVLTSIDIYQSTARSAPIYAGKFYAIHNRVGEIVAVAHEEESYVKKPEYLSNLGFVSLGIFAFLNCKNVTTQLERPTPPKVLKKRKKRGIPDIRYRTLVVDGKPITRVAGRETPEDANFRYHICRGHFADHREHGLFGKESLKGMYWVPMHARGSKRNGEVIKDYEVRP